MGGDSRFGQALMESNVPEKLTMAEFFSLKLEKLQRQIVLCTRCPRLVEYRQKVARDNRRMFRDWEYWGRPVPGFGDPKADVISVALGPAAQGANRTGRTFTCDRSGDFLNRALYEAGFANQPEAHDREDGLLRFRCYLAAALRCAPLSNKPLPQELW